MNDPAAKKKFLAEMTEPELHDVCRACAEAVVKAAADMGCESPLFALVLFNDPKVGQYVCNCRRADMIAALKEVADRLEKNLDVTRNHVARRHV